MKIIERSPFRTAEGKIGFFNRLRGGLRHGGGWFATMQAQAVVSRPLGKTFGDDYVLLRNLRLPDLPLETFMVLVGPTGVRALLTGTQHGTFRAREDTWQWFDITTRKFKPASPNLVVEAVGLANYLHPYLADRGYRLPEVEGAVLFTSPDLHVDAVRPAARIVLYDGIEFFARNLLQFRQILDADDVRDVVDALLHPERKPEPAQTFSATLAEQEEEEPARKPVPPARRIFGLTPRQFGILLTFALLDLLVLGGLLFLVFFLQKP